MLDSIRLDWNDLSKKPVAIRHTKGFKKLLRWCEDELKALRKYYNETDGRPPRDRLRYFLKTTGGDNIASPKSW